jgi:hypothetical protein
MSDIFEEIKTVIRNKRRFWAIQPRQTLLKSAVTKVPCTVRFTMSINDLIRLRPSWAERR